MYHTEKLFVNSYAFDYGDRMSHEHSNSGAHTYVAEDNILESILLRPQLVKWQFGLMVTTTFGLCNTVPARKVR